MMTLGWGNYARLQGIHGHSGRGRKIKSERQPAADHLCKVPEKGF